MSEKSITSRLDMLELRMGAVEKQATDFVRRIEWEPYLWVMRALIVGVLGVVATAVVSQVLKRGGA